MERPEVNEKLISWHHNQLIKNKQPNAPNPAKPKLIESFYEFLRSTSLTCKYLVSKTIKAKKLFKETISWTTQINNLKAALSRLYTGSLQRSEAYNLCSDLVNIREKSTSLYNEYIQFDSPEKATAVTHLIGFKYVTNVHFVFNDFRNSFLNKEIWNYQHYVFPDQTQSILNDPLISPLSQSLDSVVDSIHHYSPDIQELANNRANRVKARVLSYVRDHNNFFGADQKLESRAKQLEHTIKFLSNELESLSLEGVPYDE